MTCPWCRYENLLRARFCGQCGRNLLLDSVCDACSTPNPVAFSFCDFCGAGLKSSRTLTLRLPARWPSLPKPGVLWEQPQPQWRWSKSHFATWANRNKAELTIVALLTVIAGILRVYRIVELPDGLHGDEALTGIDAMRILQEGWIGRVRNAREEAQAPRLQKSPESRCVHGHPRRVLALPASSVRPR